MPFNPHQVIVAPRVRQRIRAKAWVIWSATHLPAWDLEDIQSELTQQLLVRLFSYNPARSPLCRFLPLALKNLAKNLHRKLRTEMKHRGLHAEVDPSIVDDESGFATRYRDENDLADLIRDVQDVIPTLNRPDRELALLLRVVSKASAADFLGRPRTTLYTSLARILRRFEEAGMRDYLK